MVDEKKAAKTGEKSGKEAVKATLQALAKPEAQKAVVATAPSKVAVQAPKVVAPVKTEPQAEAPQAKAPAVKAAPESSETPEAKAEARKEADPNKEFVDGIMAEMALKGASKKRLIKKLAEQYGFDKQKVLFRLKRALITERYAAAHEAGAGGH